MKIRKLIEKLQEIENTHGDIFVKSLDEKGCIAHIKELEIWAETVGDDKMKSGDAYVLIVSEKQS